MEDPREKTQTVEDMTPQQRKNLYELQKQQQGSTECVKLGWFHVPFRLILGLTLLFDIITDIIVIIELKDNDIDQNFYALLILFCIAIVSMIGMNCSSVKSPPSYPSNGIARLIFALFSLIGLDAVLYFIVSALTREGHTFHDYKITGPKSSRKIWGAWQAVLSSIITSHYVFYYPDSSVIAVISVFSSMLQVRLAINMTHIHKTFCDFMKNDIFSMRFFSNVFEIIGRPLFIGATTIIIIDESMFLSDKSEYHLTYDFFAWDGILLGSSCFICFIIYYLYFKNFTQAFSLMIQNFFGSALIRPSVCRSDLREVKLTSKMLVYLEDPKVSRKALKKQIQFGLGFPLIWRFFEYIALNIIIHDYEVLNIAEQRDDSILYLVWIAYITNGINLLFILASIYVLFTTSPVIPESLHLPKKIVNKKNQIEIGESQVKEGGTSSTKQGYGVSGSVALRDGNSKESKQADISPGINNEKDLIVQ